MIGKLTKDKEIAAGSAQTTEDIGLTVQTITPQLAEQLDVKPGEGVVVTSVQSGSISAMAGIKPGAVILQVNRKIVKSAEEFRQAVKASSGTERLLLLIQDGSTQRYVALSW